jgi:C-terminal processing protease CtpA/Prc
VRDLLRGAPDTSVTVSFERPGAPPDKDSQGITLTLTRRLVRVPDVKLTTFLGPVEDGIGYVQLQGRRLRGG